MIPITITQRPTEICAGEVWTLTAPLQPSQLVFVWDIDWINQFAQVTILHPYTEYATEYDLVIPRELSTLPYDVVVQTDIRNLVSLHQLGQKAGRFPDEIISVFGAENDTVELPVSSHIGSPLIGVLDARWDFKVDENRELLLDVPVRDDLIPL